MSNIVSFHNLVHLPAQLSLVKRQVVEGKALGVIHPFYCKPRLSNPERISQNRWLQIEIRRHEADPSSEKRYSAYMHRLEEHIKQTSLPIFVFAMATQDGMEVVEAWIKTLQPQSLVILLPAVMSDATPMAGYESFGQVLSNLEITHLELAGEKAFSVNWAGSGCVYCGVHPLKLD